MRRPTARITIRAAALLTFILEAITPDTRAGDFERAKALYLDRHYAEAQVIFEKIVETEPVNAAAAYYLGALALRRGNVAEAVRQLETATRLAPDSGLYHRELGDAYGAAAGQAGMFSKLTLAGKAQAAYQRAIKLEPGDIEHRLRLMNYYVQAPLLAGGGIEKAYDVAEAIRVRDPLQGGLAVITLHLAEKRWPQAFAEIDALQPLHSGNPDLSYLLARVSAASGQQLDRGEAALLHYLSLGSPKGPATPAQANQLLGTIREKAGNLTGAIAAYRAALALDANLTGVRQALDRLQDAKP
ncbi:MAG: tetratricopeptide repeat protein [Opitutaceae bacterium]|nr:tetratricopeptide repeat protein [Opitutaceae bacterium]